MITLEHDAIDEVHALLGEYEQYLSGKAEGTTAVYLRTVRHLVGWLAQHPGNGGQFQPQQLSKTAVEMYLAHLEQQGLSLRYRAQVKSTISNFAHFLIEEKELLQRNPTRGIDLRSLVKREGDRRGATLFALGYWAGCRVSDISWLQMTHTHVSPGGGWLHVG